jgi:uncharacterized protein YbjQ (UPF0145 family)
MKNTNSKKANAKNINNKNVFMLLGVILIAVLAGILIYQLSTKQTASNQSNSSEQQVDQESEAKKEASIVLSKVKMDMTKDAVVAVVGQPHSCKSSTSKENGTTYETERCSYGRQDAPGHALITFLNGRVWGTAYESGPIYTNSK